jgi:hypothetical protein
MWGLQDPFNRQAIATNAEGEAMAGQSFDLQHLQATQQQGTAKPLQQAGRNTVAESSSRYEKVKPQGAAVQVAQKDTRYDITCKAWMTPRPTKSRQEHCMACHMAAAESMVGKTLTMQCCSGGRTNRHEV